MAVDIAIASTRPDIESFIKSIGRLCHFTVMPISIAEANIHTAAQAIFLDLTEPQRIEQFIQVSEHFKSRDIKNKIHVILPAQMDASIAQLFAEPRFGHAIIWKNESDFVDAYQYSRMIIDSVGVTGTKGLLGLSADLHTIVLTDSTKKNETVEAVMQKLLSLDWSERLAQTVCSAVDEIIMNAIYDAPTDSEGQQLHAHTLRSARIEVPAITVQIGWNMDHFAVTTIDQFGSMNADQLFRSTSKAYFSDGGMKVREKTAGAGAGIGLGLILKYGGSLRSTVIPQTKTEVSILFRRKNSMLDLKSNLQFVSTFFQKPGSQNPISL